MNKIKSYRLIPFRRYILRSMLYYWIGYYLLQGFHITHPDWGWKHKATEAAAGSASWGWADKTDKGPGACAQLDWGEGVALPTGRFANRSFPYTWLLSFSNRMSWSANKSILSMIQAFNNIHVLHFFMLFLMFYMSYYWFSCLNTLFCQMDRHKSA